MPKVILTAQVEDAVKWEEGFRTHGELFRSQTTTKIDFGGTDENQVALYLEMDDLDKFMKILDSSATADAMAFDGVKRDTVKIFVLDKEFDFDQ